MISIIRGIIIFIITIKCCYYAPVHAANNLPTLPSFDELDLPEELGLSEKLETPKSVSTPETAHAKNFDKNLPTIPTHTEPTQENETQQPPIDTAVPDETLSENTVKEKNILEKMKSWIGIDDDTSLTKDPSTPAALMEHEVTQLMDDVDSLTQDIEQIPTEIEDEVTTNASEEKESIPTTPVEVPTLPMESETNASEEQHNFDLPDLPQTDIAHDKSFLETVKDWMGFSDNDSEQDSEDELSNMPTTSPQESAPQSAATDNAESSNSKTEPNALQDLLDDTDLSALELPAMENNEHSLPEEVIDNNTDIDSTTQDDVVAPTPALNDDNVEKLAIPETPNTDTPPTVEEPKPISEKTDNSDLTLPTTPTTEDDVIPSTSEANLPDIEMPSSDDDDDESWSDTFKRWWGEIKAWFGFGEAALVETLTRDESELDSESKENLDAIFAEHDDNNIATPPPLEPEDEEPINDKEKSLAPPHETIKKIKELANRGPKDSKLLSQKAVSQSETKPVKTVEPEDPFLAKQRNFIRKETIILLMRNDDIVLGELIKEARYQNMIPSKYIKEFWKAYEWMLSLPAREKTIAFKKWLYKQDNVTDEDRIVEAEAHHEEILIAAHKGDIALVRVLLDNYPELINACDEYGNNLLHIAVYKKHYDMIRFLIMRNVEVDPYNAFMETPLDMTTKNGEVARLLHRAL